MRNWAGERYLADQLIGFLHFQEEGAPGSFSTSKDSIRSSADAA